VKSTATKTQGTGLSKTIPFRGRVRLETGRLCSPDQILSLGVIKEGDHVNITCRAGFADGDHGETTDDQVANVRKPEEVEALSAE
jgi:hypothetical protein